MRARDVVPLLVVCTACAEISTTLQLPSVTVRTSVTAATGTLVSTLENAVWTSEVVDGRIVRLHETFTMQGMSIGWRRYEFDSLGHLEHASEHIYDSRDTVAVRHADALTQSGITVDTVSYSVERNERLTAVQFLAETPMLAARRLYGRQTPVSRNEIRHLVSHAAELYRLATYEGTARP